MSFSTMSDEKLAALKEWMESSLVEIRDVQDARTEAKSREEKRGRTLRVVVETDRFGFTRAVCGLPVYLSAPEPYKTREQVLREALRSWNLVGEIHLVGGTLTTTTFDVILQKKNL